jgi:hypothetical protein
MEFAWKRCEHSVHYKVYLKYSQQNSESPFGIQDRIRVQPVRN